MLHSKPRAIMNKILGRYLLTTMFLVGISQTGLAAPIEWSVGAGGNGNSYEFIAGNINWLNANAQAQTLTLGGQTGYLASVHSVAENNFLLGLSSDGWIGLNDIAVEGTYVWTSGEANTFTNWNGGEPNDLFGEDAVHLNGGGWNDLDRYNGRSGYFVEFSAPVPEPSIMLLLGIGMAGIGFTRRRRFGK